MLSTDSIVKVFFNLQLTELTYVESMVTESQLYAFTVVMNCSEERALRMLHFICDLLGM